MRDFRVITALLVTCLSGGGPANADGILVLGGTGELGIRIVKLLVEKNEDVTVFVRASSDRSSLAGLDVDYVVGDLLDQAS
ncbi:MAG: NAD-dependent epimerase/dehydratase family protein, partial [Rhodospirillaceae bacterium]|nr:NAD-dependent epimerase/dehydratase family protein [Rhodospirillaceae bacterium]